MFEESYSLQNARWRGMAVGVIGVSTWSSPGPRCSQDVLSVRALEKLIRLSLSTQLRWRNSRTVCA